MNATYAVCALLGIAASSCFAHTPRPGLINAVEGDVFINGAPLPAASAGAVMLDVSQTLTTGNGMAEMLLTTGAVLRLGPRSELRLIVSEPTAVAALLSKGEALVETLEIRRPDSITVQQGRISCSIETAGLFDFNERQHTIGAYAGSMLATRGVQQVHVPYGAGVKTTNLRRIVVGTKPDDPLYAWSSLRSKQLSLESAAAAVSVTEALQSGGRAGSWYWDPLWGSYTFLSASGHLDGPFGWPFYAPGHSHNYVPTYSGGDAFLYGPPVPAYGGFSTPTAVPPVVNTPRVPLTAPGVPAFATHR